MKKKNEWSYKIDLAVILTILIGLSYLLSYIYYILKFTYYGIPLEFLNVGVNEVVFTMFVIISPLMAIAWGLMMAYRIKDDNLEEWPWFFLSFLKERKNRKKTFTALKEDLKQYDESIVELENDLTNIEYDIKLLGKERKKYTDYEFNNKYINLLNIIRRIKDRIDKYKKIHKKTRNLLKLVHKKTRKVMFVQITQIPVSIGAISFITFIFIKLEYKLGAFIFILSTIIISGIYILMKRKKLGILISSIILLLILYVSVISIYDTYTKERYIIFEKDEEYHVVLTIYENDFLSAPLDLDTYKIKSGFSLIPINEVENFDEKSIEEFKEQLSE